MRVHSALVVVLWLGCGPRVAPAKAEACTDTDACATGLTCLYTSDCDADVPPGECRGFCVVHCELTADCGSSCNCVRVGGILSPGLTVCRPNVISTDPVQNAKTCAPK
jgi:hypothetical protein